MVRNEQIILTILAAVMGLLGGGAAIVFREGILLVQTVALGFGTESVYSQAAELPFWRILLATTGGGLVVGLLIRFTMPDRRVHAVSDVIEASTLRYGAMSPHNGIVSAIASAISIGAGASTGREGPVVHLGATVSAYVAEKLRLGRSLARTLLGCGVAAAVAASFNAPIAGAFFALEVVIGHYALKAFAPIVIASVTGTIVSRMYFGDFPAFVLQRFHVVSFLEFPAFGLLGLVSAVMAIVFMRSIALTQSAVARTGLPVWIRPACGGLLVGLIALVFPHVLGVGYEATDAAIQEKLALWLLLSLLVAKTVATAISLGFGFGGGVFSPSLYLGAMLGGAFGYMMTQLFPELSSGFGAYTIVGMGAVAGAVLGAPISTILMIFELTNDYAITIAVMIATVIASVVTRQVYKHSFFTWQLASRGLDVKGGREQNLLRSIRVDAVMKSEYETVDTNAPLEEVRQKIQSSRYGEIFVVEKSGILEGTITLADLGDSAFDASNDSGRTAGDVARRRPPVLRPADTLEGALNLMDSVHEEHIAVVTNHYPMRIIGFVHQLDVMSTYNKAVLQAYAEEQG
jgi:CIC family chloride channel protein